MPGLAFSQINFELFADGKYVVKNPLEKYWYCGTIENCVLEDKTLTIQFKTRIDDKNYPNKPKQLARNTDPKFLKIEIDTIIYDVEDIGNGEISMHSKLNKDLIVLSPTF